MHTADKLSRFLQSGLCVLAGASLVQACASDPLDAAGNGTKSSAGQAGQASGRGGEGGVAAGCMIDGGRGGSHAGRGAGDACIPEPMWRIRFALPRADKQKRHSNWPFETEVRGLRSAGWGRRSTPPAVVGRSVGATGTVAPTSVACSAASGVFGSALDGVYESVRNECNVCSVAASADCATPASRIGRGDPPEGNCPIAGLGCNGVFLARLRSSAISKPGRRTAHSSQRSRSATIASVMRAKPATPRPVERAARAVRAAKQAADAPHAENEAFGFAWGRIRDELA